MNELSRWLSNPLVLVGLCAIVGGIVLVVLAYAFTGEYERGGYESTHRRPADADAKPWQLDSGGQPIVKPKPRPKHQLNGTPDEGTRRLMPITNAARSRVVLIGKDGIEDASLEERKAARGTHHAGESPRIREPEKEDVEEEGGADRERREDEGRSLPYGEEGGADTQAAREVAQARWFRNTVTGEYIFIDEYGRRVDFDNGAV